MKLLEGQLVVLNEQKEKVEDNLTGTLDDREAVVGALEALRRDIQAMDPKIIDLENRISVEQDAAARTKLESELAALNSQYNEMVQDEQVKLAKSQTLERYIEAGKTWVDSLQNQGATQMVLINKLQTDTKQRVVLYDALSKSLEDRAAAGRRAPDQRDRGPDRSGGAGGDGRDRLGHQHPDGRDAGGARGPHGLRPQGAGAEGRRPTNASPGGSRRSSRSTTRTSMATGPDARPWPIRAQRWMSRPTISA